MKWRLFGSSPAPAGNEISGPVDFRKLPKSDEKDSSPTSSLTIKDLAEDRLRVRWCLDCGSEFQALPYKGKTYYGCRPCWRKVDCKGKPPRVAAPHGTNAANGLWEKVRRNSIVLDEKPRRNSIVQDEKPRRNSIAQGELVQMRRSSASSIMLDQPQTPSRGTERRGSRGSLAAELEEGQLSRLTPNPRMLDFKGVEKASRPSTGTAGGSTGAPRADSKGTIEETANSLPKVNPLQRRNSVAFVAGSKESNDPLDRGRHRSSSVPNLAENDRVNSVQAKLNQNRTVQAAMIAIVKDLARSKLSHGELFVQLDLNGDGELSRTEMLQGLRKLGISLPHIELDAVLRAFDADGNGAIDATEFTDTLSAWMPIVQPIIDAEEAAAKAAALAEVPAYSGPPLPGGFEVGMPVRSLAKLARESRDAALPPQDATVIGPGVREGTILVKFEHSGSTLSLKPNLLKQMTPKADKR